ncbi:TPA: hypothetical protein ACOLZV_002308 [Vibrio parahaemolyticus]
MIIKNQTLLKLTVLPALTISLFGCQSTTSNPTEVKANLNIAVYQPEGHEQFIFAPRGEGLQEYGYTNFCLIPEDSACYSNKLPYEDYLGKKGYFESKEPIKTTASSEFYPVVLETGERYFFQKYAFQNKYDTGAGMIYPLDLHNERNSFSPEPLVQGSDISLVSVKIFATPVGTARHYTLDNGKVVSIERLESIRSFTKKFGQDNPEVAKLLLNMNIKHDEVEQRYFITPNGNTGKSELGFYLGVNENSKWLRFKTLYYGNDWLFADSFIVAADEFRWRSPIAEFKRDHASGKVWEWLDLPATKEYIKFTEKMAKAEKPVVRFQGDRGYKDYQLTLEQQKGINDTLSLFKLINKPTS